MLSCPRTHRRSTFNISPWTLITCLSSGQAVTYKASCFSLSSAAITNNLTVASTIHVFASVFLHCGSDIYAILGFQLNP